MPYCSKMAEPVLSKWVMRNVRLVEQVVGLVVFIEKGSL